MNEEKNIRIIELSSGNAPELNVFSGMKEPELYHIYEPEPGLFIAETPMITERALAAGYEPEMMLVAENMVDEAAALLDRFGKSAVIYYAKDEILMCITGYRLTRGMLCSMRRKVLPFGEALCKSARRVAVLEDVMNPTNLGAIFRSAAALKMEAVLLTPGCCDPLYRRAARVSMGTCFMIPWTYISTDSVSYMHEQGFKTVAMALRNDSVSIDDKELKGTEKLAVILGTEGEGLRDETISNSDYTVKIPMAAGVDSLNVAAAAAITFWELGRGTDNEQ